MSSGSRCREEFLRYVFLGLFLVENVSAATEELCRTVTWRAPINGKSFHKDVFKNITTNSASGCRSECFLEPDCHSSTFVPITLDCRLSSSSDEAHPGELSNCPGCVYSAIKNICASKPCPNAHLICQSGFPDIKSRRCVCKKCYKGASCDEADFKMRFPSSPSISDMIYKPSLPNLDVGDWSINMWFQTTEVTGQSQQTLVHIISSSIPIAALILLEKNHVVIQMRSTTRRIPSSLNLMNGQWYHLAIEFKKSSWNWKTETHLNDGHLEDDEVFGESYYAITNGALSIGQRLQSHAGGVIAGQSFAGNISDVNIWDGELRNTFVHGTLAKGCPSHQDMHDWASKIVKWIDLFSSALGQVETICPARCGPY